MGQGENEKREGERKKAQGREKKEWKEREERRSIKGGDGWLPLSSVISAFSPLLQERTQDRLGV